ncbi:MAG: hypothetical protein IMZ55_10280 [Acidobacteria bacterium]|nr:hypothetical protein [Acidobacteriota bacterium]
MSEFTKEHPFVDEATGIRIYRDGGAPVVVAPSGQSWEPSSIVLLAAHAFIEAESASWRWVEEGKVARKGRRTLTIAGGGVTVVHDDFRDGPDDKGSGEVYPIDEAHRIVEHGHSNEYAYWNCVAVVSLLAWQAAQAQPAEPTTFGYVGTVTDSDGDVWDVMRDKFTYDTARLRDGEWRTHPDWSGVLALGTFEPVTR